MRQTLCLNLVEKHGENRFILWSLYNYERQKGANMDREKIGNLINKMKLKDPIRVNYYSFLSNELAVAVK